MGNLCGKADSSLFGLYLFEYDSTKSKINGVFACFVKVKFIQYPENLDGTKLYDFLYVDVKSCCAILIVDGLYKSLNMNNDVCQIRSGVVFEDSQFKDLIAYTSKYDKRIKFIHKFNTVEVK